MTAVTTAGSVQAYMTVPTLTQLVATNGGGTATVTIAAGAKRPTDLANILQTALNATTPLAAGWSVTVSQSTGLCTIDCSSRPFSITWSNTTLRDILGFTANISAVSAAQSGSKQVSGLWLPDCPVRADLEPSMAPIATDKRETMSPTYNVLALMGNVGYVHTNVMWQAVNVSRIREASASLARSSWEYWWSETQLGRGASWFSVNSAFAINTHYGPAFGEDLNGVGLTNGWKLVGVRDWKDCLRLTRPQFASLYSVTFPMIVSPG